MDFKEGFYRFPFSFFLLVLALCVLKGSLTDIVIIVSIFVSIEMIIEEARIPNIQGKEKPDIFQYKGIFGKFVYYFGAFIIALSFALGLIFILDFFDKVYFQLAQAIPYIPTIRLRTLLFYFIGSQAENTDPSPFTLSILLFLGLVSHLLLKPIQAINEVSTKLFMANSRALDMKEIISPLPEFPVYRNESAYFQYKKEVEEAIEKQKQKITENACNYDLIIANLETEEKLEYLKKLLFRVIDRLDPIYKKALIPSTNITMSARMVFSSDKSESLMKKMGYQLLYIVNDRCFFAAPNINVVVKNGAGEILDSRSTLADGVYCVNLPVFDSYVIAGSFQGVTQEKSAPCGALVCLELDFGYFEAAKIDFWEDFQSKRPGKYEENA